MPQPEPAEAQAAPLDLATALRGLLMWERPAGENLTDYADRIAATLIRSGVVPDPDAAGWVPEYVVRVTWRNGSTADLSSRYVFTDRAEAERFADAYDPETPAPEVGRDPAQRVAAVEVLTRMTRTETTPWQPLDREAAESPQEPRNP